MSKSTLTLHHETETQQVLTADRPITFEEFLRLFGEDDEVELVNGMVVQKMAARTSHEDLQGWLLSVLRVFVSAKNLGIVLGSRTPVKIDGYNGRLPDILFVRKERMHTVTEEAVLEAPDLVVEIRSPGDKRSKVIGLIADYMRIGVGEIWLVDPQEKVLRVFWLEGGKYQELSFRKGVFRSRAVEGFWLKVEWLWSSPRPKENEILSKLLGSKF
ncbi:MAG: Uma2 family endonuclease [Armatimonadetes bacterium]|nr:Uma2 family endonuclease [Armatimonadota bacterium]MDW8028602.1 Uma2 family endonuclease [Armatimonadota bacterium]